MTSILEAARRWMAEDPDPATREQLSQLIESGDSAALEDCFGTRLQFGTAGLRGILGPGPNRMNRALVRRVSCGLGRYLLDCDPNASHRGVVVGFDGRRLSPEMAEDTAEVLTGMGIKVHLFDQVESTPLVAFAVTSLRAAAGVVITASHNPPEYNGYKVYWDNGAQIIPPHDTGISKAIEGVTSLEEVALADGEDARRAGLIVPVPEGVTEGYLAAILALQRHPEIPRDLSVVYSAMHGVGGALVEEVLHRSGLRDFHKVVDQFEPDGDFPTVRFPNPEEPGAMDLSLELAGAAEADLVVANDPDADRLAAAVPDGQGSYVMLSGDQIGSLLGYYLLTENLGERVDPLVMTTIVSSRLLSRMAAELDSAYAETLTGFKWIANLSRDLLERDGVVLQLGYEEALGYSVGLVTADKDGISAVLLMVELAAVCKSRGIGILQQLEDIYRRFGLHMTRQHSVTLPGKEGSARIAAIMETVRSMPPATIGEETTCVAMTDYLKGETRGLIDGADFVADPFDLPASNVLALHLDGGSRILLRPSGTEPKIKYYFEVVEPLAAGEDFALAEQRCHDRLDALVDSFLAQVDTQTP